MVKESGERVFSDLLRNDDGVLTSLLRNRGLNEMEAAVTTDRFIFEMRHDLEKYGYYRLSEIGTLRIEPETKCLRLNPPVQGELPKAKPYIPQPILDESRETRDERQEARDERQETKDESIRVKERAGEKEVAKVVAKVSPIAPKAPATHKKSARPRKRVDFVIVAAIVIVLAAIIAIGYGYYVSNLAENESNDDAAMEALRVVPEQTRN